MGATSDAESQIPAAEPREVGRGGHSVGMVAEELAESFLHSLASPFHSLLTSTGA